MTLEATTSPAEPTGEIVSQPGKLMRLAAVARAMLDEARATPCDTEGCERFRRIYERTLHELSGLLSNDLQVELAYLTVTFDQPSPSPSEIRAAQAELVGWLEGLFNGIAAAAMTQQAQAEEQAAEIAAAADAADRPGLYL